MNKKQVIAVSIVAAIPAIGLLVFLVLGLLKGMLSDGATVSVTLWIVWVLAAMGSVVVGFLPFALLFFPGLLPEQANATAGDSVVGDAPTAPAGKRPVDRDEAADEAGEEDFEESDAGGDDDGEQLFEDDAMGEDFDDEFGDSFDDDAK